MFENEKSVHLVMKLHTMLRVFHNVMGRLSVVSSLSNLILDASADVYRLLILYGFSMCSNLGVFVCVY